MQQLLHTVRALRDDEFTRRYPDQTPVRVVVNMHDERSYATETKDWIGLFSRPCRARRCAYKYDALVSGQISDSVRDELADLVLRLDQARVSDLTALLAVAHPAASSA